MADGADLVERDRTLDMHFGRNARKYLPTLAELIDRLSIVQLKEIYIPDHREEYRVERALIEHDIDVILAQKTSPTCFLGYNIRAADIRAILMIMLSNRVIWENESKAREGGASQDKLLKFTHSVNGVRNTAKNIIAIHAGDRRDYKIDCFAADLVEEFGNWGVFES